MKFIYAQQQIGNMVAEIEKYIQNKTYSKDELVLICTEDHRSNCESMVEIDVETVDPNDLSDENSHPLDKYHLEDDNMDVYDDMISRGGFILLAKEAATPSHRNDMNTTFKEDQPKNDDHTTEIKDTSNEPTEDLSEEITAPGFGVDFNEPQSDAETHEDVFNPEDPNPDNNRR